MSRALNGRHAVVTGGSRGIGAAIADSLAELGARITLMGRNVQRLEAKASALPEAQAIIMDVSIEAAVEKGFVQAEAGFGPVDILINNAGIAESAPLARTDTALWQRMLAVNLTGAFWCARAVLPGMRERGWGRVVSIASTAGLKGYPFVTAYCAAKHGVIGLTRALALETVRDGITVNAVCPGYTETDMMSDALDNIVAKTGRSRDQARAELIKNNPQRRFVQPEEVAAAVAWLCGPGAEAVTGQAIAVAGGEVM